MENAMNLTGMDFGRLHVIGRDTSRGGKIAYWVCRCSCGNTRSIRSINLRTGKTRSCGCIRKENMQKVAAETAKQRGAARRGEPTRHGLCFNVFCPMRNNYKGAWSCSRCRGCEERELQRLSKYEVLET